MDPLRVPIKFGYEGKEWFKNYGDRAGSFDELPEDHPDRWAMKWIVQEAKNRKVFYKLLTEADKIRLDGLADLGYAYLASLLKFCKRGDIDRVLDPAIKDGTLLEMRENLEIPENARTSL